MAKGFEKLMSPFQIGKVTLKNRIVLPGMAVGMAKDGFATDMNLGYYEARAKGGVGLIIVETTCIDYPIGVSGFPRLAADDDKYISGLSRIAEAIHKYGTPCFLQLSHAGPAHRKRFAGLQPVGSSALSDAERPWHAYDQARALTITEIHELVQKFTRGAERAKKAGFDGIEVHAGHRYLINSFLSYAWNTRQDEYGCQTLENRARFACEIIRSIKQALGQDFPVGMRINGGEWGIDTGRPGTSAEDSQGLSRILEKAGLNHLNISGYGYGPSYKHMLWPEQLLYPEPTSPMVKYIKKPGAFVTRAEKIKQVVSIPVIGVGRLDPVLGEWLLQNGRVDLIALGRRLISDPELPNKVATGKLDEITPCMACLECWDALEAKQSPIQCRVNAAVSREREYIIKPAEKKKRVMVIGGGPAGLEVARVAALRGHQVTLYEKEPELGGLLPVAALVKGTAIEELPKLVRYFKIQLDRLGVKTSLGKKVDLALIEKEKPEVLVLAVGGIPATPDIPGIKNRIVVTSAQLHRSAKSLLKFMGPSTLRWLTKVWMPVGKNVVIIGGAIHGCEVAELLVKRGRNVTIVESSGKLGAEMVELTRIRILDWFKTKGVTMLTGVKPKEIVDKGLRIVDAQGKEQTIEADTVLIALPPVPNNKLYESLKGKVPEIHLIGDCREPNLILEAIHDGSRIGRLI